MTDFSHHTPKVLTEADAAADLAGLPRAVSSEEAREHVDEIVACLGDDAAMLLRLYGDGLDEVADNMDAAGTLIAALVSERDAIAARMAELESEVMDQCRLNGMGAERELALMGRVRELEAERERLTLSRADRECLRIGQELQRAASDLPEGFVIEIAVELGYGGVTLIDENYKTQDFTDTVDGLSHCITQAIDAALSTTPESKP